LKADTSEHLKPRSQYAEDAVQLAIAGKWDEAAKLNRFIIENFGADEESQNRLGKALSELGKLKEAKASYEAALKLNPMNNIAKKNAARINALLHQKEGLKVGGTRVDLNLFVEEMGKTVITTVDSPPNVDICSKVAAGDVAELKIEGDAIGIETSRGVRLGQLEAKLARRLIKFMRGGPTRTRASPASQASLCGASERWSSGRTPREASSRETWRPSPRTRKGKRPCPKPRPATIWKKACMPSRTRARPSTFRRRQMPTVRTRMKTKADAQVAAARRFLHLR